MITKKDIEKWEGVKGTFPTKEENLFVDALIDFNKNAFHQSINFPYIYDRSKSHKLIEVEKNIYKFIPAESWMGEYMRIIGETNDIYAIDCDGLGCPISVGIRSVKNRYSVDLIFDDGEDFYFYIFDEEI